MSVIQGGDGVGAGAVLRRTGADPNDASCVARLGSFARLMCCIEVVLMLMTSTLDSLVQLGWAARDRTGETSASIGVGACGDAHLGYATYILGHAQCMSCTLPCLGVVL